MFLGINHSLVDSFDQNSNPSLDLLKNKFIQWKGAPSRSIFFVKRSVSLSSSSWQLSIGCCKTVDLHVQAPRPSKTGPETGHWRKSTRKWPVSGPVLEGRGASGPAQGQISKRNHTPMNYKYCLVCACKGMTSPLQSKVPPQISCATGLGVPIWYTLFKVSAQLVCSWLP